MVDWGRVIGITITGLVVVFIALILLIFIIWLMGKISVIKSSKQKEETPSVQKTYDSPSHPASPPGELIAQQSVDSQTVAVIAAALSAVWDGDQPFAIQSIQHVPAPLPIWRQAGIMENTRPF